MSSVERVRQALAAAGMDARVVEFAESTRTSADAARAIGTEVAQIAKSLVFAAEDEPVLIIASGANRVDTDRVAALLGKPVRRASAGEVQAWTGFAIGGVAPVAHARPIRTLIDEDLLGYEEIWAAAGSPNAVFPTTPAELVRITNGQVAAVKEGR